MKITISVTEEDIRAGKKDHCLSCPVALAATRAGIEECVVMSEKGIFGKLGDGGLHLVLLPDVARRFVTRFDRGWSVQPFSFELEWM